VRYHLDAMEREGLVVAERHGRFVRYFAPGTFSPEEREVICAVKVAGSRAVLEALVERPSLGFAELARRARLSNGALGWYLRVLTRSAVLAPSADGGPYALRDPGAVRMALTLHKHSFSATIADSAVEVFGNEP